MKPSILTPFLLLCLLFFSGAKIQLHAQEEEESTDMMVEDTELNEPQTCTFLGKQKVNKTGKYKIKEEGETIEIYTWEKKGKYTIFYHDYTWTCVVGYVIGHNIELYKLGNMKTTGIQPPQDFRFFDIDKNNIGIVAIEYYVGPGYDCRGLYMFTVDTKNKKIIEKCISGDIGKIGQDNPIIDSDDNYETADFQIELDKKRVKITEFIPYKITTPGKKNDYQIKVSYCNW